jgi:hypothetical protein
VVEIKTIRKPESSAPQVNDLGRFLSSVRLPER